MILRPRTVAPEDLPYRVDITLHFGPRGRTVHAEPSGHWPAIGLPASILGRLALPRERPADLRRFVDQRHKLGGLVTACGAPRIPALGDSDAHNPDQKAGLRTP